MSFEIHALMQNANHDNTALVPPEEQDMAADGVFEISRSGYARKTAICEARPQQSAWLHTGA
jgi:hypothetical protein